MSDTRLVHQLYDFQWEVLDVIIGGSSLLDSQQGLTGLPMESVEDADRFMRSYGFDCQDPIESAEILGNFHEAVKFIQKNFLQPENPEGLKLEIPKKILALTDVRDLLLMSTMSHPGQVPDTHGFLLRDWACAILKVIHSIVHLDKDIRYSYFADIQKQILDRYYKVIHRNDEGKLFLAKSLDDPLALELVEFETKSKKTRESVILKTLHKPEAVPDEIFDQVGLRFVTKTKVDALRCIKYLKDLMIVMPVNVKPSRSRNSLVNVSTLQKELDFLFEKLAREELTPEKFKGELEELVQDPLPMSNNPHSSQDYRAIQFTCRQLIKLRNPIYENLKDIKHMGKKMSQAQEDEDEEEVSQLIRRVDQISLQHLQREIRFFYPYEVQVFDHASWEENESGSSSHGEYKRSQTQTALNRVMGNLLNAAR